VDSIRPGLHATAGCFARIVAYLFRFRDICDGETSHIEFVKRLDVHERSAGRLWRQLEAGGKAEDVG
jgi:hypothetical protein